jgi:hypothetical protein
MVVPKNAYDVEARRTFTFVCVWWMQVAVDIVFPGVEVEVDEVDIDAEVGHSPTLTLLSTAYRAMHLAAC